MKINVAQTILATTQCSSGCPHCPFSNPLLPKLHLGREKLRARMENSSAPLIVISGGEVFEHPEVTLFLGDLTTTQSPPFRIATGGGVPLHPWIDPLEKLRFRNSHFEGISLGTDLLLLEMGRPELRKIWEANLKFLASSSLPYSLTWTLSSEMTDEIEEETLSASFLQALEILKSLTVRKAPEFHYLRITGAADHQQSLLNILFGSLKLIHPESLVLIDHLEELPPPTAPSGRLRSVEAARATSREDCA